MIYFTSDTHFGHANIAGKNTSKWKEGYRNYKSLEAMNEDLILNINKVCQYNDTLYHLGDWSFGGIENIWKFRERLVCNDIHLILGNHDHHIEENKLLPNAPKILHAQNIFTSVSHYKEVKINGNIFVLSHYGHRVWHGSHKGWIHLYAHSHDSLPPYGKSMDVGVDVALRLFGEPRPFSVSEIIKIMNEQPLEFPDHHDLATNTGKPQKV